MKLKSLWSSFEVFLKNKTRQDERLHTVQLGHNLSVLRGRVVLTVHFIELCTRNPNWISSDAQY